jgi:nicotinate phosphoribosyltransferase
MVNVSTALLTDFYQLTMAYGYWRLNMHEQEAAFHLLFRKNPFQGNYALACGLASIIEFLNRWHFAPDDLAYLATLQNTRKQPLFPPDFLDYLSQLKFTCSIDAIPEGTVVFPHEPLLRIQGPLLQCQLLESPLLNIINFQTLIATKATRVCRAAKGDPVIEFGMRRAQGPDGALSASRAAYIGGCIATSNTLAGKIHGIPVRGTHAHSWVTAFPSELEAFTAYANVMPDNCVLLVDTYDSIQGVIHAIEIGKQLRTDGTDLLAIRLDSGDMAMLSTQARKLLDEAGFKNTHILASNSLDEYAITALKEKNANISIWGVGTHLATAYDQPALDSVYKLSALRNQQGTWEYKLKLSEQSIKISNPGRHQVRRYFRQHRYAADIIYDLSLGIEVHPESIQIGAQRKNQILSDYDYFIDLLQPVFQHGTYIQQKESIHAIRDRAIAAINTFHCFHADTAYFDIIPQMRWINRTDDHARHTFT